MRVDFRPEEHKFKKWSNMSVVGRPSSKNGEKKAWISCLRACFVVSRREACTTSSRTFGRPWTTWSFLDQERRL